MLEDKKKYWGFEKIIILLTLYINWVEEFSTINKTKKDFL